MTPYLKTERLHLYSPQERQHDVARQVAWLNDKECMKYSGQRHGHHTIEGQQRYIDSFDHIHRHFWEIARQDNNYPVGTITAYRDHYNATANLGLLIGRSEWGQGFGYQAWKAVMNWLFWDGIRKIEAGAYSPNEGMLAIFWKSGMKVEGIRKGSIKLDDKLCDVIEVGKFNDDRTNLPIDGREDPETLGPKNVNGCDSQGTQATGSAS